MELVTLKDYFNRFYKHVQASQNNYEAFCKLEEEYFEKYGRYNYTNYNAFINAKTRYIKSKGKWDRAK